jgi:macrolide transport system ATP-binding/permease protein
MRAKKLFTVLAVISLALGIGANTAIYSFLDAVLLRPLPVEDPDSLVVLNWQLNGPVVNPRGQRPPTVFYSGSGSVYNDPGGVSRSGIFPYPAFELLRNDANVFSSLFAHSPAGNLTASIQGQAEIVDAVYVSGDYFSGLGVSPAAGRPISSNDDRPGARAVALISHAFSQSRFANASDAIGQPILVNNVPFTIVGVAPPGFFGADPAQDPDFYLPMHANILMGASPETYLEQNDYWIQLMGRLRPGVTVAGAQSALATGFHQWVETTAANDLERANLPQLLVIDGSAGPDSMRRRYSRQLYVLTGLVGLILAVACANIANLLLARAAARSREIALRLSLGASRPRIVRQLLTESIILSVFGGIFGILVASWGIRFLSRLFGTTPAGVLPRAELNWHVLGIAAALSLLTGLLFGLLPAIRLARRDMMPTLKEPRPGLEAARYRAGASRWVTSRTPVGLSDVLVVSQVTLSLLLLVAAGLFVRTLSNLQSEDVGFNRENLLLFDIDAEQAGYREAETISFYEELLRRFRAMPGVRDVSLSNYPLFMAGFQQVIQVSNKPVIGSRTLLVGPNFFSTMQIPILAGREIDERDRRGGVRVTVVSELFARTNFGNENPIGRYVELGSPNPLQLEIVGVAKDTHYGGFRVDPPQVLYASYNQVGFRYTDRMTFELRTAGDPLAHVKTARRIVGEVNPAVALANVTSQADQIDLTIGQQITFARVCTAFAVLALTIACVGLYGTVAYNVARRTNEIGIRMALGAPRLRVIRMILRKVMVAVFAALAIGLPLALKASSYVESFLYAMKPNDPVTIVAAVVILIMAALLAAFIPAHRASRIDPSNALRHE